VTVKNFFGKPWKNESFHKTYEEADLARSILLEDWEESKKEGMQTKIKFMPSRSRFVVKTRLHPDFQIKEEKKHGKNKRRNKKNSKKGKINTPTVV